MADLRLYKDFYRINHVPSGDTYTLINPFSISATVINTSDDSLVETATVVQESTGVYYAIMTPALYSYSNVYEVRWIVVYVSGGSSELLLTRFRFSPSNTFVLGNIISDVDIELNENVDIELNENLNVECEINEVQDIDIDTNEYIEYNIDVSQEINCEIGELPIS